VGWVDEGALCREDGHIKTIAKKSYGALPAVQVSCLPQTPCCLRAGRGVGVPLECPLDKEYDAGLCYTPCQSGYYGGKCRAPARHPACPRPAVFTVGPVCWEHCPASRPVDGGALCCEDASVCTSKIRNLVAGLPLAIAKAIISGDSPIAIAKAVINAVNAVLGFIMPLCSTL